jgi:hypothetical protein
MQPYIDNWTFFGYTVIQETTDEYLEQEGQGPPIDPDQFRLDLKQNIATYAGQGVTLFHLIGDASDWEAFGGPKTTLYWTGEWEARRQQLIEAGFSPVGEPELDIIPTFLVPDPEPRPLDNMAGAGPYYMSDHQYGDVDNDGRLDVVVARWHVSSASEAQALANKVWWYGGWGGGTPPGTGICVWDWPNGAGILGGIVARSAAQQIASTLAGVSSFVSTIFGFPNGNGTATIEGVNLWNSGTDLLIIGGTSSSGSAPGNFFHPFYFDMSMLNPSHIGAVVTTTCEAGMFAFVQDPWLGPPACEDFLLYAGGAIAWIGPTMGTWQGGNVPLGQMIAEEIATDINRPLGKIWLVAQQRFYDTYSDREELMRNAESYVFLGDPATRLTPAGFATDAGEASRSRVTLGIGRTWPNPASESVSLEVTVPSREEFRLDVYDVRGRHVARIANGTQSEVSAVYSWDGLDAGGHRVAAGAYFVRLFTSSGEVTRKVTLLR